MRGSPVRKTIFYGAAGAILCAVALLVWVFAATPEHTRWSADGFSTLLWVIEGKTPDGVGATSMGIVSLSSTGNAVVFVPSDVSVKDRDGRLVQLGDLGAGDGWPACCASLGVLLGIPVDGFVIATSNDVVSLCGDVGPVEIDVPAVVTCRGSSAGDGPTVIDRGKQSLSGDEVLAYVGGTSGKETLIQREERALRGILAAAQRAAAAGQLPRQIHLRSSAGDSQLAAVWNALARKDAPLTVKELPTTVVVRDGVARRAAMVVEADKLVASTVRAKDLLTSDDISVAVFNGSGARLAATRAAQYLQARGFRVPRVGNADSFTYTTTVIIRLTDEAKAWILRDALPGAAKVVTPAEFGAGYESLRPMVPLGTDLVLVVGDGMEFGS